MDRLTKGAEIHFDWKGDEIVIPYVEGGNVYFSNRDLVICAKLSEFNIPRELSEVEYTQAQIIFPSIEEINNDLERSSKILEELAKESEKGVFEKVNYSLASQTNEHDRQYSWESENRQEVWESVKRQDGGNKENDENYNHFSFRDSSKGKDFFARLHCFTNLLADDKVKILIAKGLGHRFKYEDADFGDAPEDEVLRAFYKTYEQVKEEEEGNFVSYRCLEDVFKEFGFDKEMNFLITENLNQGFEKLLKIYSLDLK